MGLWVGLLVLVIVSVMLFRIRSAEKAILFWPQVRAHVVPESIVFQQAGWPSVGNRKSLRISSIMFEYEIKGCTYRSRNLLPVNWTIRESERERVQRELETFAVVFCNPTDSAEAFLDIPDRWQRGSISWITVGLIAAVLGSGLLALMLLKKYA
ncbi:MAG TPA: hypothetical protein VN631_18020 [Negativicutes bacterium]|nr:hypothetical protein [Negativicutes bacterium]